MRVLSCAIVAACVASPAIAGVLTPTVSGVVVSNYPSDHPSMTNDTGNKCLLDPLDAMVLPISDGFSFGDHSGGAIVPEARAVYEFGHGFSRKVKKATLSFKADSSEGGESLVCLNTYAGDGTVTIDDYLPAGAETVATFDYWDYDDRGMTISGSLDITSILNDLIASGQAFLGVQLASGNNVDSYNLVEWIKIDVQVPEPATMALFGLGLSGVMFRLRRRR